MSHVKRIRIPSLQQMQRWSNLVNNIKRMEEALEEPLVQLNAPDESEWDYFLSIVDQLETAVVNLSNVIEIEQVKADFTALNVSGNKRKFN